MTALLFGLLTNRRSLRPVEELTEWEDVKRRPKGGQASPTTTSGHVKRPR
jgi:hypothetical protein